MNIEELLESIELNTKYIKMNLYLILEPNDVVNLVEEYLEHCGTAIAKDVQQINDVEEASAVLAMAHAKQSGYSNSSSYICQNLSESSNLNSQRSCLPLATFILIRIIFSLMCQPIMVHHKSLTGAALIHLLNDL